MQDLARAIVSAEREVASVADDLRDAGDLEWAARVRAVAEELALAVRDSLRKTKNGEEFQAAMERIRAARKRGA